MPLTGQTSVAVSQQQSAQVVTAARTEISVAIQLLQQAIAQAQARGAW